MIIIILIIIIIIIIIVIIMIYGHFYSAANYPCMCSLVALYNGINTYNMTLMIIRKYQSLKLNHPDNVTTFVVDWV